MRATFTIAIAGCLPFLGGCALEQTYPKRFDTVTEVYGSGVGDGGFQAAPVSSKSAATFDAPFADVFSIAETSVSQNQWNIHSADERDGVILATRVTRDQFRTGNGYMPVDRHYHYFIEVDEVSGEQSRVRAVARTQSGCVHANRGALAAMSFGISEAYISKAMKECRDVGSKTMWADGEHSVKSELDNFIIVMRNHLIQLGYE